MRAVLVDMGGVLSLGGWPAVPRRWATRLGRTPDAFRTAVFAGSDATVLIGRTDEDEWWRVVAGRLGLDEPEAARLRADLDRHGRWNRPLLDCLAALRGSLRTAIVSNAWPAARERIERDGVADLVDAVVLSCEVGAAKPDPRPYLVALERLGVAANDALFVDDTAGHVEAARRLGLAGHVHRRTSATVAAIERFGRAGARARPD